MSHVSSKILSYSVNTPCGGPYLYGHVNKPHEECPCRDVKYDGVGPRICKNGLLCVHSTASAGWGWINASVSRIIHMQRRLAGL